MLFRSDVIRSFECEGWRIVVVVPKSTATDSRLKTVPKTWKLYTVDMAPNSTNLLGDIRYTAQLFKIYRKERPKVIFHFTIKPNIYGSIAARLARIPSVALVAGLGVMFDGNEFVKKCARALYKLGLRLSSHVFLLNSSDTDFLMSKGYVRSNHMTLLPGGEGINPLTYPYAPMEFDTTRFIMICRVLKRKGYYEYVQAAKIVHDTYPNIKFELLGFVDESNPDAVPMSQIIDDSAAGHIDYIGVTSDITRYVLRNDTVVVMPSKYLEGLNRTLMEACSMGRPMITTDIAGCREMVVDGINGFLVPPADEKALANAMIRMIELDADSKKAMAEDSHSLAREQFDVKHVIEVYKHVTDKLIR